MVSTSQNFALNVTPKTKPNPGIKNENGNDCFFNASMQVLSNIPALEKILNKENYYIADSIPGQLIAFFNKLRTESNAISGSKALRAYIVRNTKNESIKNMALGQHDAQEFLSYVLSTLTEESKPTFELKRTITEFFRSRYATHNFHEEVFSSFKHRLEAYPITDIEHIKHHLKDITSIEGNKKSASSNYTTKIYAITDAQITKIQNDIDLYDWESVLNHIQLKNQITADVKNVFEITLQSTLVCQQGLHQSTQLDPAWLLSLPTPNQTTAVSLLSLLNNFLNQSERVDEFFCESCGSLGGTRKFSLKKLPRVLVLSPKRFEQLNGVASRIMTPVASQEKLVLADETGEVTFHLIGVVLHLGGTGGGHYNADVKDSGSHTWYHYNDSSRSNQSIADVTAAAQEPYIFFYQRQETPADQPELVQPIAPKPEPILQPEPIKPITPKPQPVQPKPEPIQPKPQIVPIIDETFSENLKTLQMSTEMKQVRLEAELKKNPSYRLAHVKSSESVLHLFIDFLEDLLQRKSNGEVENLLTNKIIPTTDNFYNKKFEYASFIDEFLPQTYFKFFEFLVKNFDINTPHPLSKKTALKRLLENYSLRDEINKNDAPYKFDNFIEIIMNKEGTSKTDFKQSDIDKKNITDAFDNTVQELLTNTALSEKIKKLEADKTLEKIKQEIIQEALVSTKPLQNKDVIDLIRKKITDSLVQPQDPLSEKLNQLKQRLTLLKTKLGQLSNSLTHLKKALSQSETGK
jgi:ubiquitin C-terminal hydrolase